MILYLDRTCRDHVIIAIIGNLCFMHVFHGFYDVLCIWILIRSFEIKTGVSGYQAVGRLTWSPSVDRPVDRWAPDRSTDGYLNLSLLVSNFLLLGVQAIGRPAGRPMCRFPVQVYFLRCFDMLI